MATEIERGIRIEAAAIADRPTAAAARLTRRRFSPLTFRILFVNSLALVILVVGLLYIDDYRQSLIAAEFAALKTQGQIIAAALGETAADPIAENPDLGAGTTVTERLQPETTRPVLRRLVEPTGTRARVFGLSGELIADTRVLPGPTGAIIVEPLPPLPQGQGMFERLAGEAYQLVVNLLPARRALPIYQERLDQRAEDYDEVLRALQGDTAQRLRSGQVDGLVLSLAIPVQRFRQVLGALFLTTDGSHIERSLRAVRFDILRMFLIALGFTVLLSLYLAGTIARPIRRLALAAERVRRGQGRRFGPLGSGPRPEAIIPDLAKRGDEIGELSTALNEMTQALWKRLDAIERFAADVAHEIKNPLTSLKSAVETAARVKDPEQQRKLMAIIVDDVARIDRLITDISSASRLDAELSRAEAGPVDIAELLTALVDFHHATAAPEGPRLLLELGAGAGRAALTVHGLEDRLGQVFRNVIANAVSFSPPEGTIRIAASRRAGAVEVRVEDEGPGIPEDRLEHIFERFYSARPEGEKFGIHSGLGLSISKQIVEAHGGTIRAENRRSAQSGEAGACFIIRLPAE